MSSNSKSDILIFAHVAVLLLLVCVLVLTAVLPDSPDFDDNDAALEPPAFIAASITEFAVPQAPETTQPAGAEIPHQVSSPLRT